MRPWIVSFFLIFVFSASLAGSQEAQTPNWYVSARKYICEKEYDISFQNDCAVPGCGSAYHATNPAQNLRVYFSAQDIKIVSRIQYPPSWVLELEAPSVLNGKAGGKTPDSGSFIPEKNKIQIQGEGLSETFTNEKSGVLQCFTIENKEITKSPLVIRIEWNTSLKTRDTGKGIEFIYKEEPVVFYGDFEALDKTKRKLPLNQSITGNTVNLSIDDSNSVYPLEIKSLIRKPYTVPDKTLSVNQDFAGFGFSVATAGDVNGDGFTDVIVGAPYFDNGQTDEGAAFLYRGYPSGLETIPAWMAEGNNTEAHMGWSVATAGDVNGDGYWDVIIGTPYADTILGDVDVGSAEVFHGSEKGLGGAADWAKNGGFANDRFGWSVASAGDVNGDGYSEIIVGAPFEFDDFSEDGTAYVFKGTADGISEGDAWWSVAPVDQTSARFGYCVASAGDVNADGYSDVIIGCPNYTSDNDQEGASYVYLGGSEGLSETTAWYAESNQAGARFGWSVASAGDVNGDGYGDVIIGAPRHTSGFAWEQGRGFIYFGNSGGVSVSPDWEQTTYSYQIDAHFGTSVACAGDVNGDGYSDVIIGTPMDGDKESPEMGRASIYYGSSSGPGVFSDWSAGAAMPDPSQHAHYGYSVATAGDINGDGYSDVIVGAPYDPEIQGEVQPLDEGYAYVYYGATDRLSTEPGWNFQSDKENSSLGMVTATAGDVNGDGFADVIIAAPYFDNGQENEGAVFIWHGAESGIPPAPSWEAEGDQIEARFGFSAATAGDVNGDGYDDIIVGAPNDVGNLSYPGEGRVFLWYGSQSGLGDPGNPLNADWKRRGYQENAAFGTSVASAGDVNGDGFCDVIIGAPGYDWDLLTDNGIAQVYRGAGGGLETSPSWGVSGDKPGCMFGWSVACAGDVNKDGFFDVVVGAPFYSSLGTTDTLHQGAARAYLGSESGLNTQSEWFDLGAYPSHNFGYSVCGAGDVDGDGFSDILIGVPGAGSGTGSISLYHGSHLGPVSLNGGDFVLNSDDEGSMFGYSVSCAGDIDNDGKADMIIGSPLSRETEARERKGERSRYYSIIPKTPAMQSGHTRD